MRRLGVFAVCACAFAVLVNAAQASPPPDGSGALEYAGIPVGNGTGDNLIELDFSLGSGESFVNGGLRVTVPAGWSAPSTNSADPGYTTQNCGTTLSIVGQVITITGINLAEPATCEILYGDLPGPGVDAPTTPGPATFSTETKSTSGGTFAAIQSSPQVQVLAPDGSGTVVADKQSAAMSSTGNTIKFTYTAAVGGIFDGVVALRVPASWSPPSDNGTDPGLVTARLNGSFFPFLVVIPPRVFAFELVMDAGDKLVFTYGDKSFGGPGATASPTPGRQAWPAFSEASCSCNSQLLPVANPPVIRVRSADGSGTMTARRTEFPASSRQTLSFTYRPAPGGVDNGAVSLVVPSGWSLPSTTPGDPGYVTATTGTVATSGRTITVSGLTMFGGALAITYGSRTGGGPGALVPSTTGTAAWTSKQRSGPGTMTPLAASPTTTVFAPDGSGTLTTPTSSVARNSTGNTLSFTYTAAGGGMSNGSVALRVPAGWSAPSTTGTSAGFSTASTGTVSVDGQTIVVSGVTLASGATLTITYGATGGGGPGATAPSVAATQLWRGAQASTPGARSVLATSPVVSVT